MKNLGWALGCLVLSAGVVSAGGGSLNGTFHKGAAIGGRYVFPGQTIHITGEQAAGSVSGGPLTGSAQFATDEEILVVPSANGNFHMKMVVTTGNGSVVTVSLEGKTSGFSLSAQTVNVSGSWRVLSATGPDAGLRGEGSFTGLEDFNTGDTQGNFTGQLH